MEDICAALRSSSTITAVTFRGKYDCSMNWRKLVGVDVHVGVLGGRVVCCMHKNNKKGYCGF